MRRCTSLMEDTQHVSEELLSRSETIKIHMKTFCPITIQIDGCSDDEENDIDQNYNRRATDHVTNINHTADHNANTTRTSPLSKSYVSPILPPASSHRSSPNFLEVPENSDLTMLKATAVRLNLRTRTSSFLEWQAKWLDKSRAPPEFPVPVGVEEESSEKLTEERKERINQALGWLKTELVCMLLLGPWNFS